MKKYAVPYFISDLWVKNEGKYISRWGKISNSKPAYNMLVDNGVFYFCINENFTLSLCKVCYEEKEFYGIEQAMVSYNAGSNELETINKKIFEDVKDNICSYGYLHLFSYMQQILYKQKWYEDSIRYLPELTEQNLWQYFNMFLHNGQRLVPMILKYKEVDTVISYLKSMLKKEMRWDLLRYNDFKNGLKLAHGRNIQLSTAINACRKFNVHECKKFADVLAALNISPEPVLDILCREKHLTDITGIAGYLLKQGITGNGFKIENKGSINNFARTYADYIHMLFLDEETEKNMYPENLKDAHDTLADESFFVKGGTKYNVAGFKEAVNEYKCLEWTKGEYHVTVPSHPQDLDNEGKDMSNCVGSYIDKVIDRKSQICMMKQNGKPYMTIEVFDGAVRQAYGKANKCLDKEQKNILKEWAEDKDLLINI